MGIEEDVNGMVKDITSMVMDRIDSNVEFTISQEMIPEKISGEIQVPDFLNKGRVISQPEKGMMEAIHKKGVMHNG